MKKECIICQIEELSKTKRDLNRPAPRDKREREFLFELKERIEEKWRE